MDIYSYISASRFCKISCWIVLSLWFFLRSLIGYGFPNVPEKFLICKKDRDCVLVAYPVPFCGTIAVHSLYKRVYEQWREKTFTGYTFDCASDLSYYEPQCVNFKCEEIKVETDCTSFRIINWLWKKIGGRNCLFEDSLF
ncbi:MAG: hypothetical protein OXM55_03635 [Bdellovibrionales bacterium]|nr:hypothetical protein [Bdellovibrionales bacterium]